MAAYLVVDTDIFDDAGYDRYKVLVRPIVGKHGGEFIVRGGALDVVEDDLWRPTRLVVIRFPDKGAARAFIDDPEYAPVKAVRHAAAKCTVAIVDGI